MTIFYGRPLAFLLRRYNRHGNSFPMTPLVRPIGPTATALLDLASHLFIHVFRGSEWQKVAVVHKSAPEVLIMRLLVLIFWPFGAISLSADTLWEYMSFKCNLRLPGEL
jgi:hypothetical protein